MSIAGLFLLRDCLAIASLVRSPVADTRLGVDVNDRRITPRLPVLEDMSFGFKCTASGCFERVGFDEDSIWQVLMMDSAQVDCAFCICPKIDDVDDRLGHGGWNARAAW